MGRHNQVIAQTTSTTACWPPRGERVKAGAELVVERLKKEMGPKVFWACSIFSIAVVATFLAGVIGYSASSSPPSTTSRTAGNAAPVSASSTDRCATNTAEAMDAALSTYDGTYRGMATAVATEQRFVDSQYGTGSAESSAYRVGTRDLLNWVVANPRGDLNDLQQITSDRVLPDVHVACDTAVG